MIYRSKISTWLLIIIAIPIIGAFIIQIVNHVWSGVVINLLVVAFITHLFTNTYYTITTSQLLVRCGFVVNITIDIDKIKVIAETNSVLSAPALSLDRLEIFYNKYDSVVISPGDKAGFIQALTAINPMITVEYKIKKA